MDSMDFEVIQRAVYLALRRLIRNLGPPGCPPAWKVSNRIEHDLGPNSMVEIPSSEFPGFYERGFEARGLCTIDVGLNVVTDHEKLLRRHMESVRRCAKKSGARLAKYQGLPPGSVCQGNYKRRHIQRDSVCCHPVTSHSERDQLRIRIVVK